MQSYTMGIVILEDWLKKSPPHEKLDNPNSWHDRFMAIMQLTETKSHQKRGSRKGKTKFCESNSFYLMYWKSQDDKRAGKNPIRIIPIDHQNSVHVAPHPFWPEQYPYVLKFTSTDRTYFLCAKDDIQKKAWLSKLMETINGDVLNNNNQQEKDQDNCTLTYQDNISTPVEFFQQTSSQMQARLITDNVVANIVIEDWLKKSPPIHKLDNHSSWHDRYLVIVKITETGNTVARSHKGKTEINLVDPFYLMYWRNQDEKRNGQAPIRIVPLTVENSIHCVQHPYWADVYPHVLKLDTNERIFFFCAKDDTQKRMWWSAFRAAINGNVFEENPSVNLSSHESSDTLIRTPRSSISSTYSLDVDFIMSHWKSISKGWGENG